MIDIDGFVRDNVKALVPYSCARDEFQGKDGIFMDANENPYGTLNRYPDPYQKELKATIAKLKEVDAENIFLGNGSDEIIDLCFRIFCNPGSDSAMVFPPTYGMYEVSAAINDTGLIRVPLDRNFQINTGEAATWFKKPGLKLIFICSPNNPTGNVMDRGDIEYILSEFNGIVVIDEAYNDFSGKRSFRFDTGKYPNLIVMQTFSKALGLAAARIGMAFMSRDLMRYFNKMKPPYNISTINQIAAIRRISGSRTFMSEVERIVSERERLAINLEKLTIVEKVFPSDSNFLLVRTTNADSLYEKLAAEKIIVRNRNRVVPGCIRITVGTKNENNRLLKAMRQISQ